MGTNGLSVNTGALKIVETDPVAHRAVLFRKGNPARRYGPAGNVHAEASGADGGVLLGQAPRLDGVDWV